MPQYQYLYLRLFIAPHILYICITSGFTTDPRAIASSMSFVELGVEETIASSEDFLIFSRRTEITS